MAFGRPPEYKPEYCQMLIDHMATGMSYETFAATINTCRATLYNWEKQFPDFLDAKKQAVEAGQQFWEKIAIDHLVERDKGDKVNSAMWIFNMKNRFKWRDRHEIEADEETKKAIRLAYKLDE